jgi:hypothetical protein
MQYASEGAARQAAAWRHAANHDVIEIGRCDVTSWAPGSGLSHGSLAITSEAHCRARLRTRCKKQAKYEAATIVQEIGDLGQRSNNGHQ